MDYNISILGRRGAGKTYIVNTFLNKREYIDSIISPFVRYKTIFNKLMLHIWDNGQGTSKETYQKINDFLIKQSEVLIMVYDINVEKDPNEEDGLDFLKRVYKDYGSSIGSKEKIRYVVRNKRKQKYIRNAEKDDGEEFAKNIDAKFITISFDNKKDVNALFTDICEKINRKDRVKEGKEAAKDEYCNMFSNDV